MLKVSPWFGRPLLHTLPLLLLLNSALAQVPDAASSHPPAPAVAPTNAPSAEATPAADTEKHSVGHRVLWYLPNRVIDLVDIFRARIRVGPGLSAGMQATTRLEFFGGRHRSFYAGLPGPRQRKRLRSPVGKEYRYGLVFAGVDATDDWPHGPGYSPTEITAGAQLLIVGADVGIDMIEIADFLGGWFLLDVRKDDF